VGDELLLKNDQKSKGAHIPVERRCLDRLDSEGVQSQQEDHQNQRGKVDSYKSIP